MCQSITPQHEIAIANMAPNYCSLDVLYQDHSIARYCGTWGWYNHSTKEYKVFYCNSLKCGRDRCRTVAHYRRVLEVQHAIDNHGLDKFFTLTLNRQTVPEGQSPWKYIAYVWNRFRTKVKRMFPDFEYIAVLEAHKDSRYPHIHGFTSTYMHVTEWSKLWESCGGGKIVWVEKVKDNGASDYVGKQITVAKYVGKENMVNAYKCKPFRGRTIWRSRGISKPTKKSVDMADRWSIIKGDVFNGEGVILDSWGGIEDGENKREGQNMEGTFEDVPKESFESSKLNMEAQESKRDREQKIEGVARATCQSQRRHQKNNRRLVHGKKTGQHTRKFGSREEYLSDSALQKQDNKNGG